MDSLSSFSIGMNFVAPNCDNIVDFIADVFERRGAESYIGEDVSMSQHMLQAAMLAQDERADDEMIAAALLHDIGHFISEFGFDAYLDDVDNVHEEVGANLLEPFFPASISESVRLHVSAKRYLCATNSAYLTKLSGASVISLHLQGGAMEEKEIAQFELNPYFRSALRVRIWDEKAKDPKRISPGFEHFAPVLRRVVSRKLGSPEAT